MMEPFLYPWLYLVLESYGLQKNSKMLHFNTRVRRSTNDLVGGSVVSLVFLASLHASMPFSFGMLVYKGTTSSETSNVSPDMSLGDSLVR